jgi:hypothetical protein
VVARLGAGAQVFVEASLNVGVEGFGAEVFA